MGKALVYSPAYIKDLVRSIKTDLGYYDPNRNGKPLPNPDRAVLAEFERRMGAQVIGVHLNHGNIQVQGYGNIDGNYGTVTVTLAGFSGHDTVCILGRTICQVVQERARVPDSSIDKEAVALKRVMPAQAIPMAGRTIQILEKILR